MVRMMDSGAVKDFDVVDATGWFACVAQLVKDTWTQAKCCSLAARWSMDPQEGKGTPLHNGACDGYADVGAFMLSHGANVMSRATDDWTALHLRQGWRFGRMRPLTLLRR